MLPLLLPLIQSGLIIAGGLTSYNSKKSEMQQAQSKEYERQTMALKEYLEEQKSRQTEYKLQLQQLRNSQIEAEEVAASQKGDIAMAAEAARSRIMASQGSSGFVAGAGSFSNVLNEVGFQSKIEQDKAETTLRNRSVQNIEEQRSAYERSQVAEPYLTKIDEINTRGLAIGTGLSIASGLTKTYIDHAPVGGFDLFKKKSTKGVLDNGKTG
jgi:hypothetical protein